MENGTVRFQNVSHRYFDMSCYLLLNMILINFPIVHDELGPSTPLHYKFCGPPSLAEFALPTMVLHRPGKPTKFSLENCLAEMNSVLSTLPTGIAKELMNANDIDDDEGKEVGNRDTPEKIFMNGMRCVSSAVISWSKRGLGGGGTDSSSAPKKLKLIGDNDVEDGNK